jgi:hypothetical protein
MAVERRGFRSRTYGMLHLSVWTNGAETDDVEQLERQLSATVSSAGCVAVLMVVAESSPIASVGAQSRAVTMVRGLGEALRAVCIVIEGKGVQAAAVRSVFVALATVLRPRFRWKTFATTEPAIVWLGSSLEPPVTVDGARAMLRELRAG